MSVSLTAAAQHRAIRDVLEEDERTSDAHTGSRAIVAGGLGLITRNGNLPRQTDSTGGPSALLHRRYGAQLSLELPKPHMHHVTELDHDLHQEKRANGDTYIGPMREGEAWGRGSLIHNGINYSGFFFKGKRNGAFQVTIGEQIFTAKFVQDKQIGPLREAPELMAEAANALPGYGSRRAQTAQAPSDVRFAEREISSNGSSLQGTPVEEQAPQETVFFVGGTPASEEAAATPQAAIEELEANLNAMELSRTPNAAEQRSVPVEKPEWDFSIAYTSSPIDE